MVDVNTLEKNMIKNVRVGDHVRVLSSHHTVSKGKAAEVGLTGRVIEVNLAMLPLTKVEFDHDAGHGTILRRDLELVK